MHKITSTSLWRILITSITIFTLAGCEGFALSNTPTSLPPYLHYAPAEGSNVHLEFDYPSSCIFSETKIQRTDITIVGFADPRYLTVPTRAPNESHGTPSDFGSVSIVIQSSEPGQTPDTEVASRKQSYSNIHWMNVLTDYQTTIDGYAATVLEYQVNDPESSPSLMFNRRIIFMVYGQMYEIIFEVAEHERGDEFEQGYQYFFESLKIVP